MTFYSLGMFPYPSGTPHLGHVRVYTLSDVRARHARLHGHEVLHPMGWDAFGLPAENAAIARGVDPAEWTRANIAQMRATFRRMQWSFDWDREICTAEPDYYRWTQWLFLQLHARGLATQADGWVHWCPDCATVLADEQVLDGACWRCDQAVERRQQRQWMLRITDYAQALWDGLDHLTGWDPRAVAMQRNWIRRSEGAWARFGDIEVFTTRIDTLPGVVAVVVAPEHPLARDSADPTVRAYVERSLRRTAVERLAERDPSGVPLGIEVPHPLTGEPVGVWVADYVIGDYGTGAVMCVPVHDDRDRSFAEAVALPEGSGARMAADDAVRALQDRGCGGPRVTWNLRDWSVGRQRRWGCPIPVVHCDRCGAVPVPEAELPVRRCDPAERACPTCGGLAHREPDTLDTFVCSSWYAFRFTDPHNDAAPFDRAAAEHWMPIDVYVGGLDHAAQHMLYFRFVTRVLHDLGHVGFEEPVASFVCNGMVLGHDGRKMSKSSGNGRDPVEVLDAWGADALRLATLADTPVERDVVWEDARVQAKARFLDRFGAAVDAFVATHPEPGSTLPTGADADAVRVAIAAMDQDIASMAMHVAVARLHEAARSLRAVMAGDGPGAAALVRDVLKAAWPLVPGWVEARWPASWGPIAGWPAPPASSSPTRKVVVQVDGRVAAVLEAGAEATEPELQARAEAVSAERLGGRRVVRVVHVRGRLINLVTG